MARCDINRDGCIDFPEFQLIVASDPALEMLVRSFALERIVAAHLPRGTPEDPLAGFFEMTEAAVDAAAAAFLPLIISDLKANIQKESSLLMTHEDTALA